MKDRGLLYWGLTLITIGVVLFAWLIAHTEQDAPKFAPHINGQSAWFTPVETAITADVDEVDATAFMSETGIIQIAVVVNSGSATAGTITVYTKVGSADTVYTAIPTATYTLVTAASKVSDRIFIGPGYHKLVVSGATGTFNFDLRVRDF